MGNFAPFFITTKNTNMIYEINTTEQQRYNLSHQESLMLACVRTCVATSTQTDTIGGVEYNLIHRSDIIGLPGLPRSESKFSACMCALRNKGVLLYMAYNRTDRVKLLID